MLILVVTQDPLALVDMVIYYNLGNGTKGVSVFDITSPMSPAYLTSFNDSTMNSVWAVLADGSDIFIGDGINTTSDIGNMAIFKKLF